MLLRQQNWHKVVFMFTSFTIHMLIFKIVVLTKVFGFSELISFGPTAIYFLKSTSFFSRCWCHCWGAASDQLSWAIHALILVFVFNSTSTLRPLEYKELISHRGSVSPLISYLYYQCQASHTSREKGREKSRKKSGEPNSIFEKRFFSDRIDRTIHQIHSHKPS